mgnify:CR=1 FL=1
MGKKLMISIVFLLILMFTVNIILALITSFLPVRFQMPEGLVEAPHYYNILLGRYNFSISQTVLNTWAIMLMIVFIVKAGVKNISVENPGKMQIILEEYYHFIENTFLVTFGKYKKKFIPFFFAFFSFILFLNLSLFLFPFVVTIGKSENGYVVKHFFRTPTADPNTAIGLSIVVAVLFVSIGIKKGGIIGYIKSLMHPAWFMLPINIVGEISKILNTSMRLFGNMLAGLVIGGLLYSLAGRGLIKMWTNNVLQGSFSFSVGWPMLIQLYLDGFVGIIQAFVFTMLSSVYVGEVLGEESEEEAGHV